MLRSRKEISHKPLESLVLSAKRQNENSFMRQNIALLARLEIAEELNKKFKVERQVKMEHVMQRKLAELREKDFKRYHPPKPITLPKYQLPTPEFAKYCLNGEKDLQKHFDNLNEYREEEKLVKRQTEEPRHMTKVLDKIQNDLFKSDKQKEDDEKLMKIDKDKILDDLPLQGDKDEKIEKPILLPNKIRSKKDMEKLHKSLLFKKMKPVTPYRKFRAIARAIVNILLLYKFTKSFKLNARGTRTQNVTAIHGFNIAIMKSWFIEKFPVFFRNVINYDGSLDFTVNNTNYVVSDSSKKRFSKAKPIIQYFFKRLIKVTTLNEMPKQMIEFLDDFTSHGATVEPRLVTKFERDRIYLDEFDTLYNIDQYTKDFLRMYFMIGK
jgi:hypothetical protein